MRMPSVIAVIVTFNPSLPNLLSLIDCVSSQVDRIVVIDNGSTVNLRSALDSFLPKVKLLELTQNQGLATAQNVGIDWALQMDAQYVIFFDQDSAPQENMVFVLLRGVDELKQKEIKVGAVGPHFLDIRKGQSIPVPAGFDDLRDTATPKTTLIASGSLISIQTLKHVGGLDEQLFIDYVDLEWCLRASALGYRHFQINHAHMTHAIGEEPIVFLGKYCPSHSPTRHYYMFRNAIWLYKKPSIPISWKVLDGLKLIRKFIFYTLFAKPHLKHIGMMLRGVWHGLTNKMGPLH